MLGFLLKIKGTLIDSLQATAILLQNPKSILILYKLSEHITMNLYCLKTHLQCIHSKLGVDS